MSDPKPSEPPESTAKTQKLPAINRPPQEDSEEFLAQQEEVRQMIAAGVPLGEILAKLVLMIEAQTPDMVASILLLNRMIRAVVSRACAYEISLTTHLPWS